MTKVLYIQDNDDNVYMLKIRLELLDDFEVLAAENGKIGCEMAAKQLKIGDFGIHLMRKFASGMDYQHRDGRNRLTLRFEEAQARSQPA
jgi:hypothetical protein